MMLMPMMMWTGRASAAPPPPVEAMPEQPAPQ
jgi:hypothetical protein